MSLRNRIVMAPMEVQLASVHGAVTQRTIEYYARRANGGAGLVIVEASYVAVSGKAFGCQLGIDRDALVAGHVELVESIQRAGAKAALQIHHAGARADPALTGGTTVGPSAVAEEGVRTIPRPLAEEEIHGLADDYARAALRARRAGYDAVEIHGAHGYLIHGFLSAVSNRRTDAYGGNAENRMRFAALVIAKVRQAVGARFPVLFRMSAEGGYGIDEAAEIASALAQCGVDAIHVSVGGTAPISLVPADASPMARPEGWLTGHAQAIRNRVPVPVIAVGEIRHPDFAEQVLTKGQADFVALGRPLIADPDWPAKAAGGRDDEIRHCISCNYCHRALLYTRPIRCLVNPEAGREREFSPAPPPARPKRVIVVGGGPGGLEAARAAAVRGHRVVLYERSEVLGGQLSLAVLPPQKEKIEWLRKGLVCRARKAGVEIRTRTAFHPEELQPGSADAIVVATGARPLSEEVSGAAAGQVVSAWDVLQGRPAANGRAIVVLGGRQMGCETAEFLATRGNRVVLVARSPARDLAGDAVPSYRAPLLARLARLGVVLRNRCDVRELRGARAVVVHEGGEAELVDADLLVIARGSAAETIGLEALRARVPEIHVIGDCVEPRAIPEALYEAALAGRRI
jgi:2,4-dienoyl-CoA reductase-like NADH-dependent reductase (Old Yellow Enzyme family)/thioredoxin reductase